MMKRVVILMLAIAATLPIAAATDYIQNVYGRQIQMLNGKWGAIVDQYDRGLKKKIYANPHPKGKTDFYEYDLDGSSRLNVPGDWNSQRQELRYYEGTVWYGRHFTARREAGKRQFLYFAGVSQRCNVYLNGQKLASHEGAFTPFQVEVTEALKDGDNILVVEVSNQRLKDAIPALQFDWWNYGGITRDVMLVTLPNRYISYYQVQLDKHQPDLIHAKVCLSEAVAGETICIEIPEVKQSIKLRTNTDGIAESSFRVKRLERWSPEHPKRYEVRLSSSEDAVSEQIGFRNIEVRGTKVLLNGRETFLRSVSFHEEIPQRMGRAYSEGDAAYLLSEAKALGVNTIRLAHYQQNEYIVREAEKMGIMVWQEIPVWQDIDFGNTTTCSLAKQMLRETIMRDVNRCADCFWGIANETKDGEARNQFLRELLQTGKDLDSTRLYTAAFNTAVWDKQRKCFHLDDGMIPYLDIISINRYMGWYSAWPLPPAECRWEVASEKPLFISEFGGEALYGQSGDATVVSSWSEDHQEKLYLDNIEMFEQIPNLCGISPWVLFDFRSPYRMHPDHQDGWNRKGLVSDQGLRKRAWHVVHDYYLRK